MISKFSYMIFRINIIMNLETNQLNIQSYSFTRFNFLAAHLFICRLLFFLWLNYMFVIVFNMAELLIKLISNYNVLHWTFVVLVI